MGRIARYALIFHIDLERFVTARAGYDPRAEGQLLAENDQGKQQWTPPEFLSSHPTDSSRVQQIEALLPRVMLLYTAARRGG